MALLLPFLATLVAVAGAAIGILLTGARRGTRVIVPLSGGILLGISVFGLLPECAANVGWWRALPLFLAGYGILEAVNRLGYPVCPSCSHDHDHDHCAEVLHGYMVPLILATALHAFVDGWGLSAVAAAGTPGLRVAVPLAILLHKMPEGLALGSILEAASRSRWNAFWAASLAESSTLLGGFAGILTASRFPAEWTTYPLAVAGGCFLYLGYHAVHGEWERRGAKGAFVPALLGIAGAVALERGLRLLL